MKNLIIISIVATSLISCNTNNMSVKSPDNQIKIDFSLTQNGEPSYNVSLNNKVVINQSKLGLMLEGYNLSEGFKLLSTSESVVDEQYTLQVGKQTEYHHLANEKIFRLLSATDDTMDIVFRVSNDGFGFRYQINNLKNAQVIVNDENTTFNFDTNAKAWLQPTAIAKTGYCGTNPSYEEDYQQNIPVGTVNNWHSGWVYPALFNSNGAWILISETGLTNQYCATRLTEIEGTSAYKIRFPMEGEVIDSKSDKINPTIQFPWVSPWRTVAVSADLKGIVESTIGTDLACPTIEGDFSWVKPGHASWSWAKLKDESMKYDIQKNFIEYAAQMKWEYCLLDAFWDAVLGYDKVKELADYAATLNVGLLLWYNSSGEWNTTPLSPKSKLLTAELREAEFSRLEAMGIKGVKIDFFAGDGQSVMQYYNDLFIDAARHHLLVNCHGTTLPRGWQRTFPNVVTMEAVKGFEYSTFSQGYQNMIPTQSCMWLFTRNVYDPMDFTPMSLTAIPGIERATTNAFELALPVLFISGIQHFAETADGMATQPDYIISYLQDLPTIWNESQFVDGYPGKYFVAARKSGNKWYVAGINAEKEVKQMNLDLSFISNASKVQMFTDTNDKWKCDNTTIENPDTKAFKVEMQPNGGFVAVFE